MGEHNAGPVEGFLSRNLWEAKRIEAMQNVLSKTTAVRFDSGLMLPHKTKNKLQTKI
jgi:hypothetical protein